MVFKLSLQYKKYFTTSIISINARNFSKILLGSRTEIVQNSYGTSST